MSYKEWLGGIEKMSASGDGKWAPRDKTNIISKEEYGKLREMAQTKGITLIGVKKFDGSVQTVRDLIETLSDLKEKFPKVSDNRHKLELELSILLGANDYAETIGRTIKLNAAAYRDEKILAAAYKEDVESGWFVKGTTWRAIIHHEFGHVVANVYGLKPLELACEITGKNPKETLAYLSKELSKYAGGMADGREIIAEVFADISTGKASEFSRKYYARILEMTR